MESCRRLAIYHTDLPPCCVQYYPEDRSTVFIGTYNLGIRDGLKNGSIDIYRNQALISKEATGAVLDLKIKNDLVATCHHDGTVVLWKYDHENTKLSRLLTFAVFEHTVTSVNFSDTLIATCTDGQVCSIDIETGKTEYFDTHHDLECWISATGNLGELKSVLFTGGDDSKLIAHDMRTKGKIWATGPRHHEAGVVSILSPSETWNTANSNHLWTGSYDDNLRILDLRVVDRQNPALIEGYIPVVRQNENLGGGVWRLIPHGNNQVLACCMYDGARIIEAVDDKFKVRKYFKEDHESMCYGGDWGENELTTCLFYDKVVQVWDPN